MVCWNGPWEDAWKVDASLLLEQELPMVVDCREGPGPSSWVAGAGALGAFMCTWSIYVCEALKWCSLPNDKLSGGHVRWTPVTLVHGKNSPIVVVLIVAPIEVKVSWSKINTHCRCPQFMLEPTKMACNFCSRCRLSVCISGREAVLSTRVLKFHTSRVIDETNGTIHSVWWTQRPDL